MPFVSLFTPQSARPLALAIGIITLAGIFTQAQGQYTTSGITIQGDWSYFENATSKSPIKQISGDHGLMMLREDGSVITSGPGGYAGFVIPKNLPPLKQICAGDQASAGVTWDGKVFTWGNSPYDIRPPKGLDRVKTVTTEGTHFVALKEDGTAVAWGDNTFGQSTIPLLLPSIAEVAVLPNTTFLLGTDGKLIQLGLTQARSDYKAGEVERPSDFTHIAAGKYNLVGIRADGSGTYYGNYSDDPTLPRYELQPQPNIAKIYCDEYAIAILIDGSVVTHNLEAFYYKYTNTHVYDNRWSPYIGSYVDAIATGRPSVPKRTWTLRNGVVQLERWLYPYVEGKNTDYYEPPFPAYFFDIIDVDGREAILRDHSLFTLDSYTPTNKKEVKQVSTAYGLGTDFNYTSTYLKINGTVEGANPSSPSLFSDLSGVNSISTVNYAGIAVLANGRVVCRGFLGNNPMNAFTTPTGLPPAASAVTSGVLGVALLKNGRIRYWPTSEGVANSITTGPSPIKKVVTYDNFILALTAEGTLYAWNLQGSISGWSNPKFTDWSGKTGIQDIEIVRTRNGTFPLVKAQSGEWLTPIGETLNPPLFTDIVRGGVDSLVGLPGFTVLASQASVLSGDTTSAQVTLRNPAPPGGFVISLQSLSPSAVVPSSVRIPAGKYSVTFPIRTSPQAQSIPVQVLATVGSETQRTQFLISAPIGLVADKTTIIGGSADLARLTVRLGTKARKDTAISIRYDNSIFHGPQSVKILAGQDVASFDVAADQVTNFAIGTVNATQGGQTCSLTLKMAPLLVTYFRVPTESNWGELVSANLALNSSLLKAKAFMVTSSDSNRIAPFEIVVPAGTNLGTASILTKSAITRNSSELDFEPAPQIVNLPVSLITAPGTYPGISTEQRVKVSGPTFDPLFPGSGTTIDAYLRIPARLTESRTFTLTSTPNVLVPKTVTIRPGPTSIKIPVKVLGSGFGDFQIVARNDFGTATLNGTIDNVAYSAVISAPSVIGGSGTPVSITVKLLNGALKSDAVFELSTDNPGAAEVPMTVTIPAGETSAVVAVTHHIVSDYQWARFWITRFKQKKRVYLEVRTP